MEIKAVDQEKPKLGVEAKQRRALFATPYGQADVQLLPGKQAFSTHHRLLGKTSALNTGVPPFFSFRRACVAEHNAGGVGYPFGQLGSALLVTSLQTYSLQGGRGAGRERENASMLCERCLPKYW